VSLWFFPGPGFSAQGIALANADWAGPQPLLSIHRLEAQLALIPLLWGGIVVDRVEVVEPVVNLKTEAEGRRNWLLRRPSSTASSVPSVRSATSDEPWIRFVSVAVAAPSPAEAPASQPGFAADRGGLLRRARLRFASVREGRLSYENQNGTV